MSFHLFLKRDNYTLKSSTGRMHLNGEIFMNSGHTLEDCSRGDNIKIPGETCIPEGTYNISVSMSRRFGREMPMIYNQSNGYELITKGTSWKGLRIHGGNRSKDTLGCVLICKNYLNPDLIQGSLEKELTKALKELGGDGYITIINT